MIKRDKNLMTGKLPGAALLRGVLREHSRSCARMNRLWAYYAGAHDVLRRERRRGLPNTRIPHGFPAYISDMAAGYLAGSPIRYEAGEDLSALEKALRESDAPSVDAELAMYQSVLGRAAELVYADENARPRCVALDPRNAFVVYSDDEFCRPLFGVTIAPRQDAYGNRAGMQFTVYTEACIARYACAHSSAIREPKSVVPHYFGFIPLTEYFNNANETGDFERVLHLIDAYDLLQSDRLNDKQQFSDALLVLTGVMGLTAPDDDDARTPGERLRQDKTLSLPDSNSRVEWLTKETHEADTDVLRVSLQRDIHKFSMVPDLSDENFFGAASGIALRYKLLGLEQLTRIKERYFSEGLRCRVRCFARYLNLLGERAIDADGVRFIFDRALPVSLGEQAQAAKDLKGIVSDEQLSRLLPLFPAAKEET